MDDDVRRAIGLFRFGVLGPLVSARLEHGDRTAYFVEAAARHHVMPPDGRIVRLSPRTIESWFYLYKQGGFDALVPDARADKGCSRAIRAEIADLVLRAKREKPRRSVRRVPTRSLGGRSSRARFGEAGRGTRASESGVTRSVEAARGLDPEARRRCSPA